MQILIIEKNDADQRLDKFLKKFLKNATLWLIYKFNRKGKIKVQIAWEEGFKKRQNDFTLGQWDRVKLFISDSDIHEFTAVEEVEKITWSQKFDPKGIIYEDEYLLAVNKQPGINVHPWDFKTKEVSLIQQIQDYYQWKYSSLTFSPSLVHRIDRDTSGVLLIAKSKDLLVKLVEDFKKHEKITKTYRAVVFWKLPQKSWTITKKLLRIEWAKNADKVQISEKWQTAITHYREIEFYSVETPQWLQNISVVELDIETGRMHQIRVHLASIKCPIIGDKNYWNKSLNFYFQKEFWVTRQFLHAYRIELFHHIIKKKQTITADLPPDIKTFVKHIAK